MLQSFPRGVQGQDQHQFPESAWCDPERLTSHEKWQMKEGSILIGKIEEEILGIKDDRHLLTVAGSRSGKGRSAIVPNMCMYSGSILAIDPKGELASITAARRGRGSENAEGMGQQVFVLDPFKTVQGPGAEYRASFNPLDAIDADGPLGRDDAALLADSLIIPSKTESYWTDAAKMLLTGLILHVCASEEGPRRSLITVRDHLTQDEDGLADVLAQMSCSETAGGVVARAANTLVNMSDRERSSILSTAIVQTDFLDSPVMRDVVERSDFSLSQLKDTPTTVYLSLPAGRMGTHARWLRLMIALTIEAMERHRAIPPHPVLIIMDEFHALGPMQTIERAAGLIAGFGVRLWPILQDLTQLKRDYKESWETF